MFYAISHTELFNCFFMLLDIVCADEFFYHSDGITLRSIHSAHIYFIYEQEHKKTHFISLFRVRLEHVQITQNKYKKR